MLLVQIDSGYFCAGIIIVNDIIIEAAPILKWAIGKRFYEFEEYAVKKGWIIKVKW